jgi:hypothetical protein
MNGSLLMVVVVYIGFVLELISTSIRRTTSQYLKSPYSLARAE